MLASRYHWTADYILDEVTWPEIVDYIEKIRESREEEELLRQQANMGILN